jgi:hypothetical protein
MKQFTTKNGLKLFKPSESDLLIAIELDTYIREAINPIRLLEDGHYHYFDLGEHNEQ